MHAAKGGCRRQHACAPARAEQALPPTVRARKEALELRVAVRGRAGRGSARSGRAAAAKRLGAAAAPRLAATVLAAAAVGRLATRREQEAQARDTVDVATRRAARIPLLLGRITLDAAQVAGEIVGRGS
eukprot:5458925-Prymnesium_polylepis.1